MANQSVYRFYLDILMLVVALWCGKWVMFSYDFSKLFPAPTKTFLVMGLRGIHSGQNDVQVFHAIFGNKRQLEFLQLPGACLILSNLHGKEH